MKEKTQLQVFLVFLFIVASMALAQASFAAVVLTPAVAGYSASAGRFASAAGSFTMTAANDGYIAQSVVNVAGKAVTLPATLRMAANAGQIATAGMRLNPWGIAATLALPWLLDKGLSYVNGQWLKAQPVSGSPYTYGGVDAWPSSTSGDYCGCSTQPSPSCNGVYSTAPGGFGPYGGCDCGSAATWISHDLGSGCAVPKTASSVPATDSDWAALPDPLPAVAPELPYAPYLPEGVPVSQPEFSPSDVPLGNPYTKPDGSTAQSRAKISPAGDGQVTVSTYELQVTDAQGQPVSNPTPQATPDQQPDPCDQHPERLGCMPAGTDSFAVPTSSVPLSFTPEAAPFSGTCPAPISVLGQSISFQSSCDAMTMIRPLVLAFAAVMAAFILLDTFRGAA